MRGNRRRIDRHRTKPRSNISPYAARLPISVIERDGMCSIRAGGDGSSAQWWGDHARGHVDAAIR
jgi:hypothetical protein